MLLTRALFILSAFLISLYIYRIPLKFPWWGIIQPNFSDLAALFAVLFGVLAIVYRGRFKIRKNIIYIDAILGFFIVLSILNIIFLSKNMEIAFDLVICEIVGSIFVFMLPVFFQNSTHFKHIYRAYYFSAIFAYLLNIYALRYWLSTGEIYTGIPFWKYTIHISEYFLSGSSFASFPRFRYPFSSTGGIGPFLAITGIFLFNEMFRIKSRFRALFIILFSINTFFLIGTFSRAGWIICFIGIIISIHYLKKFKIVKLGTFFIASIIVISLIAILISFVPKFNWTIIEERLSPEVTAASNERHLYTRLLGFQKFSEAPLIGIGIGDLMVEGYGLHTHSVYTSFLAERGFFIFLLYVIFLSFCFSVLKRKMNFLSKTKQKEPLIYNISLLSTLIAVIFGHFFYQIDIEFIWLFYGIVAIFINLDFDERKTNK